MVSTALNEKLKKQLVKDMDLLFGRARVLYPCPLGEGERKLFWHNTFPADTIAAVELLDQQGYSLTNNTMPFAIVHTKIVGRPFHVRFQSQVDDLLQSLDSYRRHDRIHEISENMWRSAFPYDTARWAEFVEWCERCAQISDEFSAAYDTFSEIVAMCGTAGQLVRAIPELRTHLPGQSQAALADQERTSNMPFKWALFNRDRVAALQLAMCKAFLFPAASYSWIGYDRTWAKYA